MQWKGRPFGEKSFVGSGGEGRRVEILLGERQVMGLPLNQLKRRGWVVANRSSHCIEEEESSDHILLRCRKSRILCQFLLSLFGVSLVLRSLVRGLLFSWHGTFVDKVLR